jgi:hypothetical protein
LFNLRVAACLTIAGWLFAGTGSATAQSCANFAQAKERLYLIYIAMVAQDVRAIPNTGDQKALNASIEELARTYAQKAQSGDSVYLQKLIGIGLFTAYGSSQEPVDTTFRLACDVAQKGPMVLEPLTCAAIALDGARRFHPTSKELARRMVQLARDKIETDRNGAAARKMVDDVAPVLLGCASD